MKTRWAILLLLAVVLLGVAPSASLAAGQYLVIKGGLYSPSETFDVRNINGGVSDRVDPDSGFAGEVALGVRLLPLVTAELGVGYLESKSNPDTLVGETTLEIIPVTLTAKGYLPMALIHPYGEFGIGTYITQLDVNGDLSEFSGSTEYAFGLHAGAGFDVNITPLFFVGVEARYIWAKPDFGGEEIDLNGFVVTANVGLRF